ncbi:hypothetical protein E7Z59_08445 [Robertkochia marina]|uniref:Uncharacterized protein n=1 Tax=Robertkochia marina TaxID=1227945 RepID=A0A4V3UY43_9FLAO|nr:hypothetical protein [Robertkochia marina]THD67676.1 hypothetical protein E7Z59_08445 [Robertkochia marina]TRZ43407.1 hypothetical protein D3A96_10585 [Robertkochia marina]
MTNKLYVDLVDEVINYLYSIPKGADEGHIYGVIKEKLKGTKLEGYEFSVAQRLITKMKEDGVISSYSINTGIVGVVTIYQLIDEGVRIHDSGGYLKHYKLSYKLTRLQRIKSWLGLRK